MERDHPLANEWAIVCDAPGFAGLPRRARAADHGRAGVRDAVVGGARCGPGNEAAARLARRVAAWTARPESLRDRRPRTRTAWPGPPRSPTACFVRGLPRPEPAAGGGSERGEVCALVGERVGRGRRPAGDEAPGVLEVVRAADRQRRRHPPAVEVERREVAVVERAADDRARPSPGRRTRARPSRRGRRRSTAPRRASTSRAEHVQRGGLALVERHVPVLDPQSAGRAPGCRTRRCRRPRRCPAPSVSQPRPSSARRRASPELEPGRASRASRRASRRRRSPRSRSRARGPLLVTTLRHAPVRRPRSARARRRRGPRRRAPPARPGRSRPTSLPKCRSSVTSSMHHDRALARRARVSDAATSQPM